MIVATWVLYKDALKDTGRALRRGLWVWAMSIGMLAVIVVAMLLLSPLPGVLQFAGGLGIFLLKAWLFGAYLHLVAESLTRRTSIRLSDVPDFLGRGMWEMVGLMFVFWLLEMALEYSKIGVDWHFAAMLVIYILFNPAPEVIHQEHTQGSMDILARAFRWMSTHGPEWLPNLLLTAGILFLFSGRLGKAPPLLLLLLLLHPWMVFRAALYRALSQGSRRSRAWRSRF